MGYYAAGGNVAWAPPDWTTVGTGTARAPSVLAPPFGQLSAADTANMTMEAPDERRRRRQVIDLTALRRAERRIDRATRVFSRLYRKTKQGHHGLKFKFKRRKK